MMNAQEPPMDMITVKGILGFLVAVVSPLLAFLPLVFQFLGCVGGLMLLYHSVYNKKIERYNMQLQRQKLEAEIEALNKSKNA